MSSGPLTACGDPVLQIQKCLLADALNIHQLGGLLERAVLLTIGDDTFTGDETWGVLESVDIDSYYNYVRYFDEVFADPGDDTDGNDTLDDSGVSYLLNTTPGNGNIW